LAAAVGRVKTKLMVARLMKPFLNDSIFRMPWTHCKWRPHETCSWDQSQDTKKLPAGFDCAPNWKYIFCVYLAIFCPVVLRWFRFSHWRHMLVIDLTSACNIGRKDNTGSWWLHGIFGALSPEGRRFESTLAAT